MRVIAKNIPCKNLRPSQKEIDFEKVCEYIFNEEDFSKFFEDPVLLGDSPIIIYNSKYIVDGHHRWANILAVNPEAVLSVLDFEEDESIREFINRFETAKTDSSGMEQNLYKCTDSDIQNYIKSGCNQITSEKLGRHSGTSSLEECINYLIENFISLRDNYKPEKKMPNRMEMPQLLESPSTESMEILISKMIEF